MGTPETGRTHLTRHEYALRTDADYRSTYATEVLLRMAKLVEFLALREGLTFDENGELQGLKKGEEEKLMRPKIDADTVQESAPVHPEQEPTSEVVFDPYSASPDPDAEFDSEKVRGEPVSGGTVVDYGGTTTGEVEGETETIEGDQGTVVDHTSETPETEEEAHARLVDEAQNLGLDDSGSAEEIQGRIDDYKAKFAGGKTGAS